MKNKWDRKERQREAMHEKKQNEGLPDVAVGVCSASGLDAPSYV
jgi:hypothetical protein